MEEAIKKGLKHLEEMGYLKWNEHFNAEVAPMYILSEIEKIPWRDMQNFLNGNPNRHDF